MYFVTNIKAHPQKSVFIHKDFIFQQIIVDFITKNVGTKNFNTLSTFMQVNNNGVLSFERFVRQFTSDPFPLVDNPELMLIAPYWADVDTRGTGRVWYRQTSDAALLSRARREIRSAFVSQMTFDPTMLFIATWDHVGHYNRRTTLVS